MDSRDRNARERFIRALLTFPAGPLGNCHFEKDIVRSRARRLQWSRHGILWPQKEFGSGISLWGVQNLILLALFLNALW